VSRVRLPEVSSGEGVAAAGFKVFLEALGPAVVEKTNSNNNFPGFELGSVGGFAGIVIFKAIVQIMGNANVAFTGMADAFKKKTYVIVSQF